MTHCRQLIFTDKLSVSLCRLEPGCLCELMPFGALLFWPRSFGKVVCMRGSLFGYPQSRPIFPCKPQVRSADDHFRLLSRKGRGLNLIRNIAVCPLQMVARHLLIIKWVFT